MDGVTITTHQVLLRKRGEKGKQKEWEFGKKKDNLLAVVTICTK